MQNAVKSGKRVLVAIKFTVAMSFSNAIGTRTIKQSTCCTLESLDIHLIPLTSKKTVSFNTSMTVNEIQINVMCEIMN